MPTEWIEAAQAGTMLTHAVVQVNLDGTDSCISQGVEGIAPEEVRVGTRVRAPFDG